MNTCFLPRIHKWFSIPYLLRPSLPASLHFFHRLGDGAEKATEAIWPVGKAAFALKYLLSTPNPLKGALIGFFLFYINHGSKNSFCHAYTNSFYLISNCYGWFSAPLSLSFYRLCDGADKATEAISLWGVLLNPFYPQTPWRGLYWISWKSHKV